ncbi:MAG: hypothetical protein HY706_13725 [Candidatus Hydrogenedentes bacterium]|nr:hypothetical protein [Candidatus Hydrogenedentota bacterium]
METSKPVLAAFLITLSATLAAYAGLDRTPNPLWRPVADEVYLQDTSTIISTDKPVLAAAVFQNALYIGDESGVARLEDGALRRVQGPSGIVSRLKTLDGALYAATTKGLWRFDGQDWTRLGEVPVADMCSHLGSVIVASGPNLYRLDAGTLKPWIEGGPKPVEGVASYSGTVYVRQAKQIGVVQQGSYNYEDVSDWGELQTGCATRDFLSYGSRLIVATDKGLGVLRGMTWYSVQGEDGLCYEDTTCLTPGFDGDLWIGTLRGAIRNVGDRYDYYGYARWIPHDKVNAIAIGDNEAYIATDGGLGVVAFEPYTLHKKAAYYERWLDEWGMKRLGFTHKLGKRDNEWLRSVSDNDIGFSAHYFSAKCYEYAVTQDPAARAEAVDMMKTVKWSEEITSIPGFPARSVWAVGEKGIKATTGSAGLPAEWNPTPDGVWEWKGDTSSDETDAHIYVVSLFLELVAEGPERDMAIEHLRRVFGHIVDNGWVLRDVDGQPTRWARWDPEYLQRPYGYGARGLNGMEAISYMTTAYHFTQDEKFRAGKQQLLESGYLPDILRQKLTFHPDVYTDFDDRLAFLVYHPLLRYETDPELRSIWLRSLERSWEVKRIEGNPWYNYIYAAITGNDCENERAVQHLRDWPLDLVTWSMFNSHRDDIRTPKGYRNYSERIKAMSPREVGPKRVNRDWTVLDIATQGNSVEDPATWLEQYWMGRYFGFIEPPTATDPELLSVPHRNLQLGAEPYAGPPRPELPIKK